MLRLVAAQAETLWDEALPIEVRELPADLAALDVLLCDPALLAPFRPSARVRVTRPKVGPPCASLRSRPAAGVWPDSAESGSGGGSSDRMRRFRAASRPGSAGVVSVRQISALRGRVLWGS